MLTLITLNPPASPAANGATRLLSSNSLVSHYASEAPTLASRYSPGSPAEDGAPKPSSPNSLVSLMGKSVSIYLSIIDNTLIYRTKIEIERESESTASSIECETSEFNERSPQSGLAAGFDVSERKELSELSPEGEPRACCPGCGCGAFVRLPGRPWCCRVCEPITEYPAGAVTLTTSWCRVLEDCEGHAPGAAILAAAVAGLDVSVESLRNALPPDDLAAIARGEIDLQTLRAYILDLFPGARDE